MVSSLAAQFSRLKTADTFNLTALDKARTSTYADTLNTFQYNAYSSFSQISDKTLFSPKADQTIVNIIREIDQDPKTNIITEHLWNDLTFGMKFYNELKHESETLSKRIAELKEVNSRCEITLDTSDIKQAIAEIKEKIRAGEEVLKFDEKKIEEFENMYRLRKEDLVILKQRVLKRYGKIPEIENGIVKNMDMLLEANKVLEAQTVFKIQF